MIKVILFSIVVLAIYTGTHIYVPFRLANLFQLQRKKFLYVLFAAGAVSFPLALILHRTAANTATVIYYLIATTWLGFFIFLLIFTVIFEIVNFFFSPPPKTSGIVIVALAVIVTVFAVWNALSFEVNHVDIPLNGLKKELRIVHISDAHIDDFRGKSYLKKIVDAANRQHPDLVLITGDLFDSNNILNAEEFSPLKEFNAPVYFTTGNHESYVNRDKALEVLAKCNVRVLRNEIVETHGIRLIGLDYMKPDREAFDMHPPKNKSTIKEEMAKLKLSPGIPTVLMHHSPVGVKYVNRAGIDLMLSGHTHGGQIFPLNLFGRIFYPYYKGLYEYKGAYKGAYKGTYIYVSQGAGTFGPRMRLGTSNEITLITLKPN